MMVRFRFSGLGFGFGPVASGKSHTPPAPMGRWNAPFLGFEDQVVGQVGAQLHLARPANYFFKCKEMKAAQQPITGLVRSILASNGHTCLASAIVSLFIVTSDMFPC